MQIIAVIAVIITAGRLTDSESLKIGVLAKKFQQKSPIITIETKKPTSQIRRCQKRVNVIDLICSPLYILHYL